jgi:hypothetical protein
MSETMTLQEANETIAFAKKLEQAREVEFQASCAVAVDNRRNLLIASARADLERVKAWEARVTEALALVDAKIKELGPRPGREANSADEHRWLMRSGELRENRDILAGDGLAQMMRTGPGTNAIAGAFEFLGLPAGSGLSLKRTRRRREELEATLADLLAAQPEVADTKGKPKAK